MSDQPTKIPLNYHPRERWESGDLAPLYTAVDVTCVILAVCFALAFVEACQLNIYEAPMNADGSAYIDAAPCNEQWQKDHPRLAKAVMMLPVPPVGVFMLLLTLFTGFTLPYVVAGWLVIRTWQFRRQRRGWVLGVGLAVLLPVLPWIHQSLAVIGD